MLCDLDFCAQNVALAQGNLSHRANNRNLDHQGW